MNLRPRPLRDLTGRIDALSTRLSLTADQVTITALKVATAARATTIALVLVAAVAVLALAYAIVGK